MNSTDNWLETDPNLAFPGLWDLILATRANPANLFESWGKEPVFEKNAPAVAAALKLDGTCVPPTDILGLIKGTGILERIAFRTVRGEEPIGDDEYDVIVPTGTINWSIRRATELKLQMDKGLKVKRVFALASDRPCNSATEVGHPYVVKYQEFKAQEAAEQEPGIFHASDSAEVPTEADVLAFIIWDITGLKVDPENLIIGKTLDDNIAQLASDHPELETSCVYVPNNANASVSLQVRRGLKKAFSGFDSKTGKFALSRDSFTLAENQDQVKDTMNYQRPFTALSGIVRDLNERHLLEA